MKGIEKSIKDAYSLVKAIIYGELQLRTKILLTSQMGLRPVPPGTLT